MEKIKYAVDRIEEGKAVVLVNSVDSSEIQLYKSEFPENIAENDIVYITFDNEKIKDLKVDKTQTILKKAVMKKKLKSVFDKK